MSRRPRTVDDSPPSVATRRRISPQPRVTSAAMAFVPKPKPSLMPAAMAITFFTAPPTSTPITSGVYRARKEEDVKRAIRSVASLRSVDATVTAVAIPWHKTSKSRKVSCLGESNVAA